MRISLIVAASRNNVIGVDGELPWRLPGDLKHFRRLTMAKPIVMGRCTWESIGRPLPGRRNIVMTRQAHFDAPGASVVGSPEEAIAAAGSADELMVIGGGEIYVQFFDVAERVYLTRVNTDLDGDTFFPALDKADWSLKSCERHNADDSHAFDFEFRAYDRL